MIPLRSAMVGVDEAVNRWAEYAVEVHGLRHIKSRALKSLAF